VIIATFFCAATFIVKKQKTAKKSHLIKSLNMQFIWALKIRTEML